MSQRASLINVGRASFAYAVLHSTGMGSSAPSFPGCSGPPLPVAVQMQHAAHPAPAKHTASSTCVQLSSFLQHSSHQVWTLRCFKQASDGGEDRASATYSYRMRSASMKLTAKLLQPLQLRTGCAQLVSLLGTQNTCLVVESSQVCALPHTSGGALGTLMRWGLKVTAKQSG
eukprot:1151625-Pelagomonas_calceolata.AAC.1